MDFWKQTKINCHYILTIILHLISLSQNIATFLLNNEYFLELSIGNTTVATSGARIAYPSDTWVHNLFLFIFRVDPFRFSVLSIGKLCLPMSLSIIVFVVVSWFLVFNHVFLYLLTIFNGLLDFVVFAIYIIVTYVKGIIVIYRLPKAQ